MLSRSSTEEPSGRRGALFPDWLPSRGGLVLALLLLVMPLVIALAVTTTSGPLFGAWGWAEFALVLLMGEVVLLLTLGMYRGEHNPYRTVVPSASHWGSHTNDPLVIYAGTLRPPIAADARRSGNNHPILLAIAPAIGALAMLGVVVFGPENDAATTPPEPAALPIVAVDQRLSLMLESVELQSNAMTLSIRLDDIELDRSTAGYVVPQVDDVTMNGMLPDRIDASFDAIHRIHQPGYAGVTTWRMHVVIAPPPADASQPLTVTFHTIRFAPNHDIPKLPSQVDGNWSFTFIPATS
ncbi:MAG TPA: hypothetical protein VFV93_09055 [Thermomicrobiales bacterium]|nr:hypothetical protein [Thermomicrobiales bacterium]